MPQVLLFPFAELVNSVTAFLGTPLLSPEIVSSVGGVFYRDLARRRVAGATVHSLTLVIDADLVFALPGLSALQVAIASGGEGYTTLDASLTIGDDLATELRIEGVTIALRFPPEWLRPVRPDTVEIGEGHSEIVLFGAFVVSRSPGNEFDLGFEAADGISLSRSMIADTGVIVSATSVTVELRGSRKGLYFREATLELPRDIRGLPNLRLSDGALTAEGFSGSIALEWNVATTTVGGVTRIDSSNTEVIASVFDAELQLAARSLSVRIDKNRLTEFAIRGALQFPSDMFDSVVEADVRLGEGGQFLLGLRALGDDDVVTLAKEGVFTLTVDAFTFTHSSNETALSVDGALKITALESLGSFGIKGFTLFKAGSDGWRFRLAGGTVKINKSIDLFGVARADIIEIGLIQDGSTTCVVFSAGVEVLEGVQGGAWVDNMRVCLGPDPSVQIDGVRVSLVVPDSFAFIGGIKKKEEGARKYLEGEVALFLFPVELEIGAAVKIGRNEECRFAFQSAYVVWLTSPRF